MIGAIPQAQPSQKSPLKKLIKYRAIDFKEKKEYDPATAEHWLERTERILQQLHCTPEQSLECAVLLLQ